MAAWLLAVELGIMLGDYVYHRWFDDKPNPPPAREVSLPRVDDGAQYPRLYGRCRVVAPIVMWADRPLFGGLPEAGAPTYHYFLSMLLVLGIPFEGGTGALLSMYVGDTAFIQWPYQPAGYTLVPLSSLKGDGTDFGVRFGGVTEVSIPPDSGWPAGAFGAVEFLNGNPSQRLVDTGSHTPLTEAGRHMINTLAVTSDSWGNLFGAIADTDVPAFRGFLSAFLYNYHPSTAGVLGAGGETLYHWCVGPNASVSQYSFEAQTLPASWLGPNQQVSVFDGDITRQSGDANPVDVCYDLLFGVKGKLGLDPSMVDLPSWRAAAATLDAEFNGYSRSIESGTPVTEVLADIFGQIDGGIVLDPNTGKLFFRLVRADYDPSALLNINKTNCTELPNFVAVGNTDIPNSVRIGCRNRVNNYADDSGVAHDDANAIAQSGEFIEVQLRCEGVAEVATGNNIAARELAARGRTYIKCSAIVDRLTFKDVLPLDVLTLTYPEPPISGVVMRVAAVRRGPPSSTKITLDLIQDYNYVWRNQKPSAPGIPPLKTPGAFSH